MDDDRTPQDRLAALAAHLSARRFGVDLTAAGLVVEGGGGRDVVTCGPRSDDGGRWWFFTAQGAPIAPADEITNAGVAVLGYMSPRAATGR